LKTIGDIALQSERLAQPLEDRDSALGEPSEKQHSFFADSVNDITDLLVVKNQIDELGDFDIVNSDLGFVSGGDD
jgi:hypothetical protein